MSPRRRSVQGMPVMKAQCASCPFGPNGDAQIAQSVLDRVVVRMSGSQICHHPALKGKRQTHLCRGARDIQLKILTAYGLLPEPTDAAFTIKSKELGVL